MTPRSFALIAGSSFLALTLAELAVRSDGSTYVVYSSGLLMLHLASGLLGLASVRQRGRWARWYAMAIGLGASLVALGGFIPTSAGTIATSVFGVSLPMVELVVHLILGVGGLFVGFGGSRD